MYPFDFYNPTHIVFGKDRLPEIDRLVPKDARVLILYGGGSAKRFGTIDAVKKALGDRFVMAFGGIEANPQFTTLMRAAALTRENDIDFLLAVGGGSVMDGTKFVALAHGYEGDEQGLLKHGLNPIPIEKALPLGTVVTLPATGSEMNMGGVISHGNGKYPVLCAATFPRFSILDPTLTYTLPAAQVANGVVDTFVHVMEQYLTFPAEGRFQDRTAEGILLTLTEVGYATLEDRADYDPRANLMWCATMALNGLIGAGVPQDWTSHMIGHEITALHGVDHGRTLAVILPAVMRVRREQKREKLLQYGRRVWGVTAKDENAAIDEAIARTEFFFESLGVPTRLSAYGIGEEAFDAIIAGLKEKGHTAMSERGDLTLEDSRNILKAAL